MNDDLEEATNDAVLEASNGRSWTISELVVTARARSAVGLLEADGDDDLREELEYLVLDTDET